MGTFQGGVAVDPNNGGLVANATLDAYSDSTLTTAATLTFPDGSSATSVSTSTIGAYLPFTTAPGINQVWLVDAATGYVNAPWSYEGLSQTATTSQIAAEAAAASAQTAAAAADAAAQAAADAGAGATDAAIDEGIDRAIADGRISGLTSWADVAALGDFPATFPPTTGTTADVAATGDHNHDGRYTTTANLPAAIHANGTNYFVIAGYDSPRVHPKTGVALTVADVVEWECYESDPDPVNYGPRDRRFDYPDPAVQPALTLVGTGAVYDPVSSLSTRNITLPTGITTGDTILIAVSCPGGSSTITTPSGYTLVADQSSTGIHGYLFVKENATAGDSAATVAIASSAALRVAAVAIALRGAPTSATVDGTSAGTPVTSGITVTTGSRTSGTDTIELAFVFRTGAINGGLVTAPDGSWSKAAEAADASSNGGGAAVMVAHNGLTTSAASTGQGGDAWAWTGATGAQALTVAVKAA